MLMFTVRTWYIIFWHRFVSPVYFAIGNTSPRLVARHETIIEWNWWYSLIYIIRTRIPSPLNPSDLPPASTGRTYVYRTRIPRRDAVGAASSPPPENNVGVPITRRRGAVKHNKVHVVRGHRLVAKFFRQPTFCAFCKDFLWYDTR